MAELTGDDCAHAGAVCDTMMEEDGDQEAAAEDVGGDVENECWLSVRSSLGA